MAKRAKKEVETPVKRTEFYEADGRTAYLWRNGTRTQRKMFMTEAECKKWVAKQ